MVDKKEKLKKTTEELLDRLGLGPAEVTVEEGTEDEGLKIEITGDDLGVLIGYHGETLSSLQHLLGMITYRALGEWVPLLVDVAGYRQARGQKLTEIAHAAADRVRFLQKEVELVPMPAWERRLIHLIVADSDGVSSGSIGEGYSRRVVIKPSS